MECLLSLTLLSVSSSAMSPAAAEGNDRIFFCLLSLSPEIADDNLLAFPSLSLSSTAAAGT